MRSSAPGRSSLAERSAQPSRSPGRASAHAAHEYVHSGDASGESFALSRVTSRDPGRARATAGSTREPRQVPVRGPRPRDQPARLLARLRERLWRMGEHRTKRGSRAAPSRSRCASRSPPARCRSCQEARPPQAFREVFSVDVDPRGRVRRPLGRLPGRASGPCRRAAPPREKVDLLLLGDGYTAAEMDKWHADAKRLTETLFAETPFKQRRADFNVWAIDAPADESGVSRPSRGDLPPLAVRRGLRRVRLGALRARVERALARARGHGALRVRRGGRERPHVRRRRHPQPLRDRRRGQRLHAVRVRARVRPPLRGPRRRVLHLARSPTRRPASASSHGSRTPPPTRGPPSGPTSSRPAHAAADALGEGRVRGDRAARSRRAAGRSGRKPGPRPRWRPSSARRAARTAPLLAGGPHGLGVGAYEGALYEAKGYYRPRADCLMFTRNAVGFCPVCRREIERVIDQYAAR